jgi:glycosyltransferase involved in cell wall biosynthesis
MRIVHLVNNLVYGGVQIMAVQKLIDFSLLGHEVALVVFENGPMKKEAIHNGITVKCCKNNDEAKKFITEFKADILHGHSCCGGSEAINIGKEVGMVCGETVHSICSGNKHGNFEIVCSDLLYSLRPQSDLIYWGFNTDRLTPQMSKEHAKEVFHIPQDAYVIARVSRLDGSKLPEQFIEVLSLLDDSVYGIIGGKGEEEDNLKAHAEALKVSHRINFTGASYRVGNMFVAADSIVYPTHDESFCAGVVEPMYQKKPVVCYIRGGMGQHAIHNQTALVGNSPNELAYHVNYLRNNPDIAKSIGEAGFEKCNSLGYWDSVRDAKQHIEVYERELKKIRG